MLIYIAGILTGMLLSFGARLADKDVTRIVDGYKGFRSVKRKKPIIINPQEDEEEGEENYGV